MAHRLSQMVFLKILLIQDYRGLRVKKSFFTLLAFLKNGQSYLHNFLDVCRGQWGISFEQNILFKKKYSGLYRGLSVGFFKLFGLFSKTALFSCMIIDDNRVYCLS